jgi:hypothetical protein
MHYPERVFEPSVHRAGVYHIRPGKLTDAPQPLECGLLNDSPFPIIYLDEAMDRTANLVCAMGVFRHAPIISSD